MRIASLIPSGTDLVATLGLSDQIVGVSHECDHPDVAGLPVLTSSVIPAPTEEGPSLPAAEIDHIVSSSVAAGESLYRTDRQLLNALAPDVIVSQDVCDVCAVNATSALEAMCDLPDGAELVMLTATSVSGLYDDLAALGRALKVDDVANAVIADLREQIGMFYTAGRRRAQKARVLTLEWSDPPFLGGHWVPELVEITGAQHVITRPGEPSRRSTWDEITAADPDVIVFCPCGYNLHQASTEALRLGRRPEVAGLRAVATGQFYAVDANRLLSRCTTNVIDAIRVFAALSQPGFLADEALPVGVRRIRAAVAGTRDS